MPNSYNIEKMINAQLNKPTHAWQQIANYWDKKNREKQQRNTPSPPLNSNKEYYFFPQQTSYPIRQSKRSGLSTLHGISSRSRNQAAKKIGTFLRRKTNRMGGRRNKYRNKRTRRRRN